MIRHQLQAVLVLGLGVSMLAAPAVLPAQAGGKLDDPTIVAIFDAANTWDMESSGWAPRRAIGPTS